MKMRAVIFRHHGGLEQLKEDYVPLPEIGEKDVLVKVHAASVNHLDLWNLSGLPKTRISMPYILGCDVAGEVVEKGSRAGSVPLHRPVIVSPGISCGKCRYCKEGWDSMCPSYKILGFQVNGGFAEYVRVPAKNILPVTKHLSMEEWASIPLVFLTAWHMLITRGQLKKKETVLIHAAGSGIGSAAIQIARLKRCRVITTVGSAEKIKYARSLKPDDIINYSEKDFSSEVMKMTKARGADVVFDHIGGEMFTKNISCLGKKGRLLTCGATAGRNVTIDLRYLYMKQLSVLGCYMGGLKELKSIVQWVKKGRLRPVVDKVFPLRQTRQALARMMRRENFGKIIVKP